MLGTDRAPPPPRRGGAARRPVARGTLTMPAPASDQPLRVATAGAAFPVQQRPVATQPARTPVGAPDDLLLRVTPPRVPRHQVARPRLQSDHAQLRDFPV